jgi:hypothetical protein
MADEKVYTITRNGLVGFVLALALLAAIPFAYYRGKQSAEYEPETCACGQTCQCNPNYPTPHYRPRRPRPHPNNGDLGELPVPVAPTTKEQR